MSAQFRSYYAFRALTSRCRIPFHLAVLRQLDAGFHRHQQTLPDYR